MTEYEKSYQWGYLNELLLKHKCLHSHDTRWHWSNGKLIPFGQMQSRAQGRTSSPVCLLPYNGKRNVDAIWNIFLHMSVDGKKENSIRN